MRTHFCGLINEAMIGQTVTLCGWTDVARNLGGVCFIDLRDHEGIVQVTVDPSNAEVFKVAASLGYEDVLQVEGVVRAREAVNANGYTDTAFGRVGRVLVVDGASSMRRALVGGNLAEAAARNGWAGIVVDGAVRDVVELSQAQVGIRALALVPMRTAKRDEGQADLPVQIQGVWVRPGDWLYADEDGMVISARPLHS